MPGTDAAREAAAVAARAARQPPHALLAPATQPPPAPRRRPHADMSAAEVADRIVAVLLRGSGPILLCVPGTRAATWATSMLATARAAVAGAGGPISAATIPYANAIMDIARRLMGIAADVEEDVLALVLRRLRDRAPQRPILIAAESQGAWLTAETLRAHPALAAAVTRVVLFAKPGFVRLPPGVGTARAGASLLQPAPRDAATASGILEFRHVDDIVPSLFHRIGPPVLRGVLDALVAWSATGSFDYPPHYYDRHGEEAAEWLLRARLPARPPVHDSGVEPADRRAPSVV